MMSCALPDRWHLFACPNGSDVLFWTGYAWALRAGNAKFSCRAIVVLLLAGRPVSVALLFMNREGLSSCKIPFPPR